jgi:hypothetical protein
MKWSRVGTSREMRMSATTIKKMPFKNGRTIPKAPMIRSILARKSRIIFRIGIIIL